MSSTTIPFKPHPKSQQEFEFRDGQRPLALDWLDEVGKFYENRAQDPPIRKTSRPGTNDVLEMMILENAADLAPNLSHHRRIIRHETIILYLKLAAVFDRTFAVQAQFEEITSPDQERWVIPSLMRSISSCITPMIIGFVTGLEAHYLQANLHVRDVAVSAVTALIQSNRNIFLHNDHLASIWNLTLLLDVNDCHLPSILLPGTRLPIIISLQSLTDVICQGHRSLVRELLRRLLTMPGASTPERDAIRVTVQGLFRILVDITFGHGTADRNEGEAAANNGTRPTLADAYEAIQALVSGRTEAQYDQIHWATATLTRIVRQQQSTLHPSTKWFLDQLVMHLSPTSPSLVRYGICLIVSAVIEVWPESIDIIPDLYSNIINSCNDTSLIIRDVSLSILYSIATYRNLLSLVDLIQAYDSIRHGSCYINIQNNHTGHQQPVRSHPVILSDILAEAVMYGPNLSSYQLTSLLASSRYMSPQIQLDTLHLVCHWANRAQDLDPHLVQQLLPMLQTRQSNIQIAILSIFRALNRALPTMSRSLLRSSETYFRQLLSGHDHTDTDADNSMILVLDVLAMFPLHDLPAIRIQNLLSHHLGPCAFSRSCQLRHALYNVLSGSRRFWITNDLSYSALCILLIAIGDEDIDAVQSAVRGFQDVSSGPQWKSAASTSTFHSLLIRSGIALRHRDQAVRISAYDHIVNAICNWTDQDPLYGILVHLTRSGSIGDLVRQRVDGLLSESGSVNISLSSTSLQVLDSCSHSIYWYILLFSKLNIYINQIPAERALRSLLTSTHGYIRAAAVDTTIKTCFRGSIVHGRILDQTIADAVDALIVSENEAVQDSWICVLDGLVRYQIPGLNPWLTARLLPTLTDLYADRPSSVLRHLVHFLDTLITNYIANTQSLLIIFENIALVLMLYNRDIMESADAVISSCIERLRNTTRHHLIANISAAVRTSLEQLYGILAECAALLPIAHFDGESYSEFLLTDVNAMINDIGDHGGDPLITNLTQYQRQLIGRVSISGLGSCRHTTLIPKILTTLSLLLSHTDYQVRRDAISSIYQIRNNMGEHETEFQWDLSSAIWQSLSLLCDIDLDVRVQLERGLSHGPTLLYMYIQAIQAPDLSKQIQQAMSVQIDRERFTSPDQYDCGMIALLADSNIRSTIDDDYEKYAEKVMQIPRMDSAFLDRVRAITAKYILSGHEQIHAAIRNLCRFLSGGTTAGSAAIIISQLLGLVSDNADIHDDIIDLICRHMEYSVTGIIQDKIYGLCVALTQISTYRPILTVQRVVSWSCSANRHIDVNDGLVYALHSVIIPVIHDIDITQSITSIQTFTLLNSLRRVLQSTTATKSTQKLALDLHLALTSLSDTGPVLITNLLNLIEALHDPDLQDQLIQALKPQFASVDQHDPVIQTLLERIDEYEQNGTVQDQQRALTLLSIVSDSLVDNDTSLMGRVLALLADTDLHVRRRAMRMIVSGSLSASIQSRLCPVLEQQHKRNIDRSIHGRSQSIIQTADKLQANMAFRLRTSFLRINDYSVLSNNHISATHMTSSNISDDESHGTSTSTISDDPLNVTYLSSERYSCIAARYHSNLIFNQDKIVDDASTGEYTTPQHINAIDQQASTATSANTATGAATTATSAAGRTGPGGDGDGRHTIDEQSEDQISLDDDDDQAVLVPVPPSGAASRPSFQRRTTVQSVTESGMSPRALRKLSSTSSTSGGNSRRTSSSTLFNGGNGSRARLRRESARGAASSINVLDTGDNNDLSNDHIALNEHVINDMSAEQIQTMLTATVQSTSHNANSLLDKLLVTLEADIQCDTGDGLRADMKSRMHCIGVLVNLIASFNQLDDRAETSLARLRRLCSSLRRRCINLRNDIIDKIDEDLFSITGLNPVMIANQCDTDRYECMQDCIQRSMIDIDYRHDLIKHAYNRHISIESNNRYLSAIVIFIQEIVKGFGRLYSYLNIEQMTTFCHGMEFMVEILTDDHDGIRKSSRDALQQIIRGREDDPQIESLAALYEKLLLGLYDIITDDLNVQVLRRKKTDLCAVLGLLLPQIASHSVQVRETCLRLILSLWDDPDILVRDVAIDTVRILGAGHRVPEIDALIRQTGSGPSQLMQHITIRLNNDTYASKEKLQNLMQWLFNRR